MLISATSQVAGGLRTIIHAHIHAHTHAHTHAHARTHAHVRTHARTHKIQPTSLSNNQNAPGAAAALAQKSQWQTCEKFSRHSLEMLCDGTKATHVHSG